MSPKPQQTLKIHPAPFAPSKLSTPPSPFSPLSPLEPIHTRPIARPYATYTTTSSTGWPHPPSPLHWVWTCHQCSRSYGLGVTRRCLDDGHTFCYGTTTVKTWKGRNSRNPRSGSRAGNVKRHRACGSEFDYQGWKAWGRWRRSGRKDSIYDTDSSSSSSVSPASYSSSSSYSESPTSSKLGHKNGKNCWRNCDYPSECRWGRQFGVHTPLADAFPTIISSPVVNKHNKISPPGSPEGVLKVENIHSPSTSTSSSSKKPEKTDFWGTLLASATRRKSSTPSSPLASVSEESETQQTITTVSPQALLRDHDGDIQMPTLESSVTTLKSFIGKKSKRVKRSKSSEDQYETRRSDTTSHVSEPVTVVEEEEEPGDVDMKDTGRDEFGFARLERVRSRDSGYHSTSSNSP